MTKFAVSYINWFANNLQTKIIEADTWKEALDKSEFFVGIELPEDFQEAKEEAFNCDSMFEVVEVN